MKSELKAKFLQHLAAKKSDNAGFTLIELLVVIIIIGILSAIALPSFLNQAAKARQSEAKTYVGSINRGQQAFRLENTTFTTDLEILGIGVPTDTTYYDYSVEAAGPGGAATLGTSNDDSVKSYIGGVQLEQSTTTVDATSIAVLCEATQADDVALAAAANLSDFNAAGSTLGTDLDCGGATKRL